MKLFAILSLLLFLASACKKGAGTFELEGQVMDESFAVPLEGATVELFRVAAGSNQMSYIASTTTKSDGKYAFSFPRTRSEAYILKVSKNMYFEETVSINYDDLELNTTNIVNCSTRAKSWIQLRIIKHLYGAVDTSIYCINDGNFPYAIEYAVYNSSNSGILSEISTPFDTTLILLAY
ncbi:MAG: carboxypeptidase regulatory-like domain-containing protein [Flavobacteriia bacterium]|nr:carboxypeptidase regulatory-like domain-containing protein [Flavobacteriia bacterium]